MAWSKTKKAIAATTVILAVGAALVLPFVAIKSDHRRIQRLADGSTLALNQVALGQTPRFLHGNALEKRLGDLIPNKGLHLAKFQLTRPKTLTFPAPDGKTWLAAEFKLTGTNLANHPLVKPAFYREFRCVIRSESGIEFVHEFLPDAFQSYSDGYFGYVVADRFPRDSRSLWFLIERRTNSNQGGPWSTVAQFKVENPSKPIIQTWSAGPAPITRTIGGMDFILNQITVLTQAYSPHDIWNHVVTTPFEVRSNGIVLTNWDVPYIRVEDASGNWDYNLASHRGLDHRYVWKLDADFEPSSELPAENVVSVDLPKPSSTITTNVLNVPVKISWHGYWMDVDMPTNRPDLALRFICVMDAQGERTSDASGSWNQHFFRKGSFMWHKGGVLSVGNLKPATVTFAIVPNVHATFYAQPRLVVGEKKN